MPDIAYTSTKLLSCFNMKDEIQFEEKHGFVCQLACATEDQVEDQVGEGTRRLHVHVKDHMAPNHSSYLVKHAVEKEHFFYLN